jgi:hypothetical protein
LYDTFIEELIGMRISDHFPDSFNFRFKFGQNRKSFAMNYKNEMNKKLNKRSIIHSDKARNEINKAIKSGPPDKIININDEALRYACKKGHDEILKLLLSNNEEQNK